MRNAIVRIAIAASLLSGSAGAAEEAWTSAPAYPGTLFVVNWEIAGPIRSFSNYIDAVSLRGGSFESRTFIRKNVSIGLTFSWNRFSQTFDMVQVPITNGAASGPVFRTADMFGIRGIAHYYVGQEGPIRPYLGFGIGGMWNYATQQIADLTNHQDNFNFVVDPEVGVLYWFGTSAALNIAFRYTYTTATAGREHDLQTLSGVVGVAFGY